MTEDELRLWAELIVTLTGLTVALAALRHQDFAACDKSLSMAVESGSEFAARLERMMGAGREARLGEIRRELRELGVPLSESPGDETP
jgi:hypothetical protein